MWDDVARSLATFADAVLTALDSEGFPVSVRHPAPHYDPATGEFPVVSLTGLALTDGPANVLCHYHDEGLWNLRAIQIKGRVELRASGWIFITTEFRAPPRSKVITLWKLSKDMRAHGKHYLDTHGATRPEINWDAIREIRRRARH